MSSRMKAMVALGMPVETAKAIGGGSVVNNATAAGSASTDAYAIVANLTLFTTVASSTGAILPATAEIYDAYEVGNGGAQTLKIYPPSGGKINNGSADAAISVVAGKGAYLKRMDSVNWIAMFS